jgi:hypothetical protein
MRVLASIALTLPLMAGGLDPWPDNRFYWQYNGQPVLLVGGSDDDNLFQWPPELLRTQLDTMKALGANYVRNTMSDRRDHGFEHYPFLRPGNGKYDLEQWNPEYWRRFERFLAWTAARGIVVQIEVWDRFDYSRDNWLPHPYNPANNVNYTFEQSGFAPEYPDHPGQNKQPFFFTTPKQRNNEVVLRYQRRFVDKMLSYSLKHDHVLYCMDNETKGEEEWGRFWATYIKDKAKEAGRTVYVTEMWDDWDLKAERHKYTLDHPELYDFVDMSQNNHNSGEKHWANALWVREYLAANPRPINTVKTYGADGNKFGHTDQDAVERVWRHLLAGFASARFHRPDSGLGLSAKAQATIKAVRKVESAVPFWDLVPRPDLLSEREENEAYLAAKPSAAYVVYFPSGGSVKLQGPAGGYALRWVNGNTGEWGPDATLTATGAVALQAPGSGHWVAVVVRR